MSIRKSLTFFFFIIDRPRFFTERVGIMNNSNVSVWMCDITTTKNKKYIYVKNHQLTDRFEINDRL